MIIDYDGMTMMEFMILSVKIMDKKMFYCDLWSRSYLHFQGWYVLLFSWWCSQAYSGCSIY